MSLFCSFLVLHPCDIRTILCFFFSVLVPCVLHIRVAVGFVGTSRWFRLECDGLRYTSFKDMVSSVVGQGGVGWLCLEVRVDSSSKAFAKGDRPAALRVQT